MPSSDWSIKQRNLNIAEVRGDAQINTQINKFTVIHHALGNALDQWLKSQQRTLLILIINFRRFSFFVSFFFLHVESVQPKLYKSELKNKFKFSEI